MNEYNPRLTDQSTLNQKIRADTIDLLYGQLATSQSFSVSVAAIIVGIFWNEIGHTPLILWLLSIILIAIIRLFLRAWHRRRPPVSEWQLRCRMMIFVAGVVVSGLAWGAGGLFLIQHASPAMQTFIIFVLGGLAAGALTTEGQHWPSYCGFALPLLLPVTCWLFLQDTVLHKPMGFLLLLFAVALITTSWNFHNIVRRSFLLRHEKEQLLRSIQFEKDHVTSLNRKISREIKAHKATIKDLDQMAHHDVLTNLPNRALFATLLDKSLAISRRNEQQLALMFLDLDGFKQVNDTAGHDAGDQVLIDTAGRLIRCVRASDTVARFAGDEFIILINEVRSKADARFVANKILELIGQPFHLREDELQVSASIGISLFPADGSDMISLLKNADTAMYRAKDKGKNNFRFYSG